MQPGLARRGQEHARSPDHPLDRRELPAHSTCSTAPAGTAHPIDPDRPNIMAFRCKLHPMRHDSCRRLRNIAFVAAMALVATSLPGQVSAVYGGLRVSITDATGGRLPGARVEIRMLDRNLGREATTGHDGSVYFPALAPGEYVVSAKAADFARQEARTRILLGHEASLEFRLQLETQREQVTVSAAASGEVDSYTIPVHTHVNAAEIDGLPVNQRNFLDLALLDSGLQRDTLRVHAVAVTSGFNVLGQRPRSNSVQLDGADINDETTGGVRGSVPMEAVQEFQVLTTGYQAEYGRASGGVVNVISKGGTNKLHGSVFGFLRHRSLDATNAFSALKDPPYTRTQYGGSISGPLRKGRSFFFTSFEQLRRQESGFSRIGADAAAISLTPAQAALKAADPAHPAIATAERGLAIARTGVDPQTGAPPPYRVTPLEGLGGVYPVSQRSGACMLRADHEISAAHRLVARFNYAHDRLSSFEAQNNDQIAGLLSLGRTAALTTLDPTGVLTLNSVLSLRAINDFRFSWGRRRFEMTPNSLAPPVNIPGAAFIGRENILPHYRTERHAHLDNAATISLGRHTLKIGADVMFCPATVEYHRLTNGLFTFGPQAAPGSPPGSPQLTPVQAYGLGLAANFVQQFGDPLAGAGKTSIGAFAQDSWRASPRFTVDFGLRYDVESAESVSPSDTSLQPLFQRLGLRRSPPTDWNNLQPRLGFGYQILEEGRLTLRGSYGIYYDRLLNLATYLARVGDGGQMTRVILPGGAATAVFQSPSQKLAAYAGGEPPTGLISFSSLWELGYSQQGNLVLSSQVKPGLVLDASYVWLKGTHLPRSRDFNPPDSARAATFLLAGNLQSELLRQNFFRPAAEVSETMAFEGSANSVYHGVRLSLRGQVTGSLAVNASYTFSKAIDDAEEIFPHTRAQDMRNFRAERGLALYDQRHRFVFAGTYDVGKALPPHSPAGALLNDWSVAPMFEAGSGRPGNVLLGFDNNLDQDPGSDRPDPVSPDSPGSVRTRYGFFAVPPLGQPGSLGRNAFVGPGFAAVSLRFKKDISVTESVICEFIAEGFNLLNRTNVRTVNPNYTRAGEPLSAFDPRQIQFGIRFRF
jgi:hypothetical protein